MLSSLAALWGQAHHLMVLSVAGDDHPELLQPRRAVHQTLHLHRQTTIGKATWTLRLRAVSRGLAAAVRTLPGGLFAKLSFALPDASVDAEGVRTPRMHARMFFSKLINLPCSAGCTSWSAMLPTSLAWQANVGFHSFPKTPGCSLPCSLKP